MSLNAQLGSGAWKAHVAGLISATIAYLTPTIFALIEFHRGVVYPLDLKTNITALTVGVGTWIATWLKGNTP